MVMIPRNYRGRKWKTDKTGRWRSPAYLEWVRTLPSCVRYYNAPDPTGSVVVAHMRYPGCGMGVKPADCLVYPCADSTHKYFHSQGHPELSKQMEWVMRVISLSVSSGLIVADDVSFMWMLDMESTVVQSVSDVERLASGWANLFIDGHMEMR